MTFGDGLWRSFDSATVSHVCTACTQHAAQESVTSVRGVRQMHNLSIVMPDMMEHVQGDPEGWAIP